MFLAGEDRGQRNRNVVDGLRVFAFHGYKYTAVSGSGCRILREVIQDILNFCKQGCFSFSLTQNCTGANECPEDKFGQCQIDQAIAVAGKSRGDFIQLGHHSRENMITAVLPEMPVRFGTLHIGRHEQDGFLDGRESAAAQEFLIHGI
ncbi:hypothetical protein D3C75_603300 [compost metagenome]